MADDYFELSPAQIKCKVVRGKVKGNKVQFSLLRNGTEFTKKDGQLTGEIATCAIDSLPEVKADEDNWELTWKVISGTDEFPGAKPFTIWPHRYKLSAVGKDKKGVKGVQFVTIHDQKEHFSAPTSDKGSVTYIPRDPGALKFDVKSPFKTVKWNKKKGREREAEVETGFVAAFVAPRGNPANALPNADPIEQMVNLDSGQDGQDGRDSKVTVEVAANTGKPDAKRTGKIGDAIFIQVRFGRESGRDDPVPKLTLEEDMEYVTSENGGKLYKGKVKLTADAGTAKFKVELGYGGGDTCEIKIGQTDACRDQTIKFVNWRTLYYELLYPAIMKTDLTEVELPDKTKVFDIPKAVKDKAKERLGSANIKYELVASHEFVSVDATPGTIVKGPFVNAPGRKRHVLGGILANAANDPIAFSSADKRCMHIRLCDKALSSTVTNTDYTPEMETDDKTFNIPGSKYALEYSTAVANTKTIDITGREWTAKVNPAVYYKVPAVAFDADVSTPWDGDSDVQVVKIQEVLQNKSHDVEFTKTLGLGHIATDVSHSERADLDTWVEALCKREEMQKTGNKLRFKLSGATDNPRRRARMASVRTALQASVTANGNVAFHPGLDDDGNPLTGAVGDGWVQNETYRKLRIVLPKRPSPEDPLLPGDLAGAISATQCPIAVEFELETTYSINGNAANGRQILVLSPDRAMASIASTMCHELGHSMGMTIFAGKSKIPPGLPAAKHVDNGGTYYLNGDTAGNGIRKCHKGAHCAFGLSNTDKALDSYDGKQGSCIMFGAGGSTDDRPSYCDTCMKYLKARKLVDIRGRWNGRDNDEY